MFCFKIPLSTGFSKKEMNILNSVSIKTRCQFLRFYRAWEWSQWIIMDIFTELTNHVLQMQQQSNAAVAVIRPAVTLWKLWDCHPKTWFLVATHMLHETGNMKSSICGCVLPLLSVSNCKRYTWMQGCQWGTTNVLTNKQAILPLRPVLSASSYLLSSD